MKNPWDATAEGIYDFYDDPIAAEAEAVAGYHAAMQDYAEACMAEDQAAEQAAADEVKKQYVAEKKSKRKSFYS